MKNDQLNRALEGEKDFFNELINKRIINGTIPIEADFRRATKFLPKDNESREIIDPKLYRIVQGNIKDELIERISFSGGKVLDICCGPGGLSLELARNGLDVIGYDISDEAINIARLIFYSSASYKKYNRLINN